MTWPWPLTRGLTPALTADPPPSQANASTILEAAQSLPADTILWIRKGRFSMHEDDPTATPAAQRYAGLWLRERFWQALNARATAAGLAGAPSPASAGRPVCGLGVRG